MENNCARETIGKKLAETTDHIGAMSVQDWAHHDEKGNQEVNPSWPFLLEFEPYDVYGWTDSHQSDFTDQFKKIHPGTVLFKVFAYKDPLHKLSGERGDLIGRVVLTSEITTSLWGDQSLFFKHQRIDDDLEYFPWWGEYLQTWNLGRLDKSGLVSPPTPENCPFKFIFDMWDEHKPEVVPEEEAEEEVDLLSIENRDEFVKKFADLMEAVY